jgi:hypothetical protein
MAYYLAKGNQKDLFEDNQRYIHSAWLKCCFPRSNATQ